MLFEVTRKFKMCALIFCISRLTVMPRKKRKHSARAELPFAKFKPTVKAEDDNQDFGTTDNAGVDNKLSSVFNSAAKSRSPKVRPSTGPEKTSEEFEVNSTKRSFFNEVMSNMGGFGENSQNNSPIFPVAETKPAATSVVGDLFPSWMHTTTRTRDSCT